MIRMRSLQGIVFVATLVTAGALWAVQTEKPLDNAGVIELVRLDMGDAVVIAKIKSASAVQFATGTEDLVALKKAGVSGAVIAALLDRSAVSAPSREGGSTAAAAATVTLETKDGPVGLTLMDGDVKTIVAPFVGMRRFVVFPELASTVRTKDRKASVTIAIDKDPRKTYWLVRLDPDDDEDEMNRSVDIESPGMFGGVISSAPDEDVLVKCTQTEETPGLWRFTPARDLKPGEYGIYIGKGEQSASLFDFGVDK